MLSPNITPNFERSGSTSSVPHRGKMRVVASSIWKSQVSIVYPRFTRPCFVEKRARSVKL